MLKRKTRRQSGLHFVSCDLHIHTPASSDYEDKTISEADLVNSAVSAGLDAICVTDHNTADWVERVAAAAKGTNLAVFPGVEINVTGGKEGTIHVIAIFDVGTPTTTINDMLTKIGLDHEKRGDTKEIAAGDLAMVLDRIVEFGGIATAAHVDSSHGMLHDMKGQARIKAIKERMLSAVEITNLKTARFLDGSDPNYRRSIATYQSSDAHSLAEIGKRRSYFKVSAVNLEALRQCFIDHQVGIRHEAEFHDQTGKRFPMIESVSIDRGFFEGQEVRFHPSQNCVIGGQGVGKSLLVELLRFSLDQQSSVNEIRKDSCGKISAQLGASGSVTTVVSLTNGTTYSITRTYDADRNPLTVVNLSTGETYDGSVSQLFPVVAYSQTEAIQISKDSNAQLELIDRFIDARSIQGRINDLTEELKQSDRKIASAIHATDEIEEVKKELATVKEEIANITRAIKAPILKEMTRAETDKTAFGNEISLHKDFFERVDEWIDELDDEFLPEELASQQKQNKLLVAANEASANLHAKVASMLKRAKSDIKKSSTGVKKKLIEWQPEYDKIAKQYEEFLENEGGGFKELNAKRRRLEKRKTDLSKRIKQLSDKVSDFQDAWSARTKTLDSFEAEQMRLFEARQEEYKRLTELSEGKILLEIEHQANSAVFSQALREIATGTRIRKTALEAIVANMTPRGFIDAVVSHDPKTIATSSGLDDETVNKLVGWLNNLGEQEVVLEMQYLCFPIDRPSIQFRKTDGHHYPIGEVSVGQRCTALMIVALSAGDHPIIIDQPEESIDIASVFSDVVASLRHSKHGRQFILTTHNPNIAVTADSDLIHVLKATATTGEIVNQGSLEDKNVRKEVIDHLEGGRQPYLVRGQKYGLVD